jgi:hypothetical protein
MMSVSIEAGISIRIRGSDYAARRLRSLEARSVGRAGLIGGDAAPHGNDFQSRLQRPAVRSINSEIQQTLFLISEIEHAI